MRTIRNMSMFAGLTELTQNFVVDPVYVPEESQMMDILREVFSVDERSGLPKGDLAYYLSPDGNPQVKQWLENNLLKPRAVENGTSVEGVTDDMLAEMAKGKEESVFDYAQRLRGIFDTAAADIEKYKAQLNVNGNE